MVITAEELAFQIKVKDRKKMAESYIVMALYKDINLCIEYDLDGLFGIEAWKFYYELITKAVKKDIKVFDEVIASIIVDESGKEFSDLYQKHGGWRTIEDGLELVQVENIDSHLTNLRKINAILKVMKLGFPIDDAIYEQLMEKDIESIQEEYEAQLARCFNGLDNGEKVEDLSQGLMNVVLEANEAKYRGFPYNSKMMNSYTNGMSLGNITMLSANSGIGKTFLTIAEVMPSFIKDSEQHGERLTILANEEDSTKWKQAIIAWVANNVVGGSFDKTRFNKGKFTVDEMILLKKAVEWLNTRMESGLIEFVGFKSFTMSKAVSLIKKQNKTKGVKYFILDTLKMDSTTKDNDNAWLQLQNNMVKLFDTIKPQSLNCFVFVTYQLGKSAMSKRYLDQSALGVSKNVVDVVSTLLIARKAFDNEKRKEGEETGGIKVSEFGVKGVTKYMQHEKDYFVVFLSKNRFGTTSEQMVFEVDMARNKVEDFGWCKIEQDF